MGDIGYSYYNVIVWKNQRQYEIYPHDILSFEFDGNDYDYLLFLKFENQYFIPDISQLISSLGKIYNSDKSTFVVLTPYKKPPLYTASEDEFVFSFSCNFRYFKKLIETFNKTNLLSTDLLFDLLDKITKNLTSFKKILIRQFPFEDNIMTSQELYDVIIPHKGDNELLKSVLYFLKQIRGTKVLVGIDQPISNDLFRLKSEYINIQFFHFSPNPVGPYVIRNHLIEQSKEDLLFFQDSDDIPCSDRFDKLAEYMQKEESELCGSHELRVNYLDRTIRAIRFPIDVMASLKAAPWHPLLHGASAIKRAAFYKAGKLSEERNFGNDTKFLLYCYFVLQKIKNIDEFLYLRKIRPESLTMSTDTKIGSEVRRKLLRQWNFDFEQIKKRHLRLEDSSLMYQPSMIDLKMNRL
jgi:hypothetical protein